MISKKNNTLLWELLPPEGSKSSYLFGTIHLPEQELLDRIDEVKNYIDQCDVFIAEYALDSRDESYSKAFYLDKMLLDSPPMTPLSYQKLRKQIKKSFSVDLNDFPFLKPMIIEQFLAESLIEHHSGNPMDLILWNYAKDGQKKLLGAETIESQLEIMHKFPVNQQIKGLIKIGKNPAKFRRLIYKMKAYYKEENIPALYRTSMQSLGKMKDILVYKRNIKISEAIIKIMEEKSLLCAVGAGHLYGHKGILRYLKRSGIGIRPLYR